MSQDGRMLELIAPQSNLAALVARGGDRVELTERFGLTFVYVRYAVEPPRSMQRPR